MLRLAILHPFPGTTALMLAHASDGGSALICRTHRIGQDTASRRSDLGVSLSLEDRRDAAHRQASEAGLAMVLVFLMGGERWPLLYSGSSSTSWARSALPAPSPRGGRRRPMTWTWRSK